MKSITMNCNKYYLALFCGALVAGCLISCSEEVSMPDTLASGRVTNFVTSLTERATTRATDTQGLTRASGDSWDAGDRVGIYMVPHVGNTNGSANLSSATYSNVPYRVSEGGTGSVSLQAVNGDNAIIYPDGDSQVNFVAYYPYRETGITDNNIYKVNVSKQSSAADIDLCYHKDTGTAYSNQSRGAVPLSFTHQLSKMILSLTSNVAIDASQVVLTLNGFPSTADFDLSTGTFNNIGGTDAPFTFVKDAASSTETRIDYEALLVPHVGSTNYSRVVTFTIKGKSYDYTLDNGKNFQPGEANKYTFRFTGTDIVPVLTGNLTDWETTVDRESANLMKEPLLLDSKANCIVVPSGNAQGLNYGFVFGVGPQITAYHTYAAKLKAGTGVGNRRDLDPPTLLGENDTWTASILWMDGVKLVELDANACSGTGPKGQVRFRLPTSTANTPVSGNALIEVKKNGGATVWSWHLWILPDGLETLSKNRTEYTPENMTYGLDFKYKYTYIMLNYNLGATKTGKPTTEDYSGSGSHSTFGLYYQWGRKDPFPNTGDPGDVATGYYTFSGGVYSVPATTNDATLSYILQHPDEFCVGNWSGSDGDYSWGGYDGSDHGSDANPAGYFTQVVKTPFDPCPVGYRVPPAGAFDSEGKTSTDFLYGHNWSNSIFGPVPATFPASGCRLHDGEISYQGTDGFFYTASSNNLIYGIYMLFYSNTVYPLGSSSKNLGGTVRCIVDNL